MSAPQRVTRHALVVMGTAGAGKTLIGTTLAAALAVPCIEGDAFHPPANVAKMASGTPLTDEDRWGWLQTLADRLREARTAGSSVVLTCSALRRRYRDLLRSGDDSVRFIFLAAPPALLQARVAARAGHFMPASLIDSQLATLEPPDADEQAWTIDANATPEAIVTDILARLAGPASPVTR